MGLSNTPQRVPPKLILRADFSKCTLGTPTFVTSINYNQSVAFSDLNSSVMTDFFDSSYTLQCQSIIDRAATDATDFTSVIENSIVTTVGPFGALVPVLFQNIKNKTVNPGESSGTVRGQTWLKVARAPQPGGLAPTPIDSIYVSYWQKLQVNGAVPLENFLVHGHASQAAFWLSLFEYKKGFINVDGVGRLAGAGDARFMFRTDEDADGLHWLTRWDNVAANSTVPGVTTGTTGPFGITGGNKTFLAIKTRSPLPPSNLWFKTEIFIEKGHSERRTLTAVTPANTMQRTVIADISSPNDLLGVEANNNAQCGIYGDEAVWSQMFFGGKYSDSLPANYPLNGYIYDLQIWDRPPYTLTPPAFIPPEPVRAFPGAQGFGAASVGGRGGTIIKVTNLNDSGVGSLRAALTATYPRTIVFTVGGTIDLLSDIVITGANMSYFTVAGQTAPGGGIQTRYKTIEITNGVHDFIIRYIRHRRGWETYTPNNNNHGPGLTIYSYGAPVYNGIIDHCSFAWAQDDTGNWQSVHDVTWQWNILSEGKNTTTDGDPPKGTNGKGMIAGTEPGDGELMYNISIHHNFIVHNWQRNPSIGAHGPTELVNNLIYNYGAFGTNIRNYGVGTLINIIGNYYKVGPDTNTNRYAVTIEEGDAGNPFEQIEQSMYVRDNISPQRPNSGSPDWDLIGYCGSAVAYCTGAATSIYQRQTPWTTSAYPITIDSAINVPALVLAGVGAVKPGRDTNDARLVTEYWAGTGSIHTYNDWPTLSSGTVTIDTDTVVNPHSVASNGYTNLENYINSGL